MRLYQNTIYYEQLMEIGGERPFLSLPFNKNGRYVSSAYWSCLQDVMTPGEFFRFVINCRKSFARSEKGWYIQVTRIS